MHTPHVSRAAVQDEIKKCHLSSGRQRLVKLTQAIVFGRIEHLVVRGGEPVFDPKPHAFSARKGGGGHNQPRPQAGSDSFVLKREVLDLLAELDRLRDGVIDRIEVVHGLPVLWEFEDPALV